MENNFDKEIIRRTLVALNLKNLNEIARLTNTSQQNITGYIKRGTFLKLVEAELYKRKININWVKTGQGNMETPGGHGFGTYVGEPQTSYASQNKDSDLLIKTAQILESNSVYRDALKSNIVAFHTAITCHEELVVTNKRVDAVEEENKKLKEEISEIKERLPAIGES